MAETLAASQGSVVTEVEQKSILDQIADQGRFGTDTPARERGKDLIKEFLKQVIDGSMTVAKDTEMMINARYRANRPPAVAAAE